MGKNECFVDSYDYNSGYAFDINEKNMHNKIISKNRIKKITIDKFCANNQITKITGIKIDVDGIDLDVLRGAEKIIKKDRPSVIIELYSEELIDFFSNHNYNIFTFSSTKEKPYNLKLEKINNFIDNKWVKMVCCIPKEHSDEYKEELAGYSIKDGKECGFYIETIDGWFFWDNKDKFLDFCDINQIMIKV